MKAVKMTLLKHAKQSRGSLSGDSSIAQRRAFCVVTLYFQEKNGGNAFIFAPSRVKNSIPFSQFLRPRRSCSNDTHIFRKIRGNVPVFR